MNIMDIIEKIAKQYKITSTKQLLSDARVLFAIKENCPNASLEEVVTALENVIGALNDREKERGNEHGNDRENDREKERGNDRENDREKKREKKREKERGNEREKERGNEHGNERGKERDKTIQPRLERIRPASDAHDQIMEARRAKNYALQQSINERAVRQQFDSVEKSK